MHVSFITVSRTKVAKMVKSTIPTLELSDVKRQYQKQIIRKEVSMASTGSLSWYQNSITPFTEPENYCDFDMAVMAKAIECKTTYEEAKRKDEDLRPDYLSSETTLNASERSQLSPVQKLQLSASYATPRDTHKDELRIPVNESGLSDLTLKCETREHVPFQSDPNTDGAFTARPVHYTSEMIPNMLITGEHPLLSTVKTVDCELMPCADTCQSDSMSEVSADFKPFSNPGSHRSECNSGFTLFPNPVSHRSVTDTVRTDDVTEFPQPPCWIAVPVTGVYDVKEDVPCFFDDDDEQVGTYGKDICPALPAPGTPKDGSVTDRSANPRCPLYNSKMPMSADCNNKDELRQSFEALLATVKSKEETGSITNAIHEMEQNKGSMRTKLRVIFRFMTCRTY